MRSRNLTEFLLTGMIGKERAAAISGDLLELACRRGRFWYYAACVKTVVAFTWRLPTAFLAACMGFILVQLLGLALSPIVLPVWLRHPYVAETLEQAACDLGFLVAFAVIRYGAQDRLFKLSVAASVLAGLAFVGLRMSVPVPVLATLGLLSLVGLLVSSRWRGAAVALALAITIGIVMDLNFGNLAHLYCWVYAHKPLNATSHYRYFELGYAFPHTVFWVVTWTISVLDALTLSLACSRLHRFVLPSPGDVELA
jgi:hypothetical protein